MSFRHLSGVAAAVVLTLPVVVSANASASAPERPVAHFSISATCADVPGRLTMRVDRVGSRQYRVGLRADRLADRPWFGESVVQGDEGAYIDPFQARMRDRAVRHSTNFRIKDPWRFDVSLFDFERQEGCEIDGNVKARSANVRSDWLQAYVAVVEGRLVASVSAIACDPGSLWNVRAILIGHGTTRHLSLGRDTCRSGTYAVSRTLRRPVMPRRFEVVARSSNGEVQRASYTVRRGSSH